MKNRKHFMRLSQHLPASPYFIINKDEYSLFGQEYFEGEAMLIYITNVK